nr:Lrp/AsnC family transcriptional regulator [Longispora albida]
MPKDLRLDSTDRKLLALLARDGRMSNAALAEACGIAASTCLTRLRALRDQGVIRGFHADVDLAALGFALQAMVSVRLAAHGRAQVDSFRGTAARLPGVLAVYHVTGQTDYLLHVAVPGAESLRDFVLDHLLTRPEVAHAETSLIFEHIRGDGVAHPGP